MEQFQPAHKKIPLLGRSAVEFLPLMFATIANFGHIAG